MAGLLSSAPTSGWRSDRSDHVTLTQPAECLRAVGVLSDGGMDLQLDLL